jgi:adenosylcobalamin-dependent ribonucleoside-triphosphate reductase
MEAQPASILSPKKTLADLLADYKPAWGPIGEEVFKRTYARDLPEGRKETWVETVLRTVDGNLGLVDPKYIEQGEREKLIELLLSFGALPAGRHLSASGVKGRQFLFNCHGAGWDKDEPWAHFTFLFDELMQGGGVGANYSNRYLDALPAFVRNVEVHVTCRPEHPDYESFKHLLSLPVEYTQDALDFELPKDVGYFQLADSREGWIDGVEIPLRAAWGYSNFRKVVLDISDIREKGRVIKTGGGVSPGPLPLVIMLGRLHKLLANVAGKKLTSFMAMELDHRIAECVVAGGKRRSSRMSVKSWRDEDIFEFIAYKEKDGDNWTTNISVEIDDAFIEAFKTSDEKAVKVLEAIVRGKMKNGEPGIWNRSLSQQGEREPEEMYCPNPCGEIGLYMWENCNLGHINLQYFAGRPLKKAIEAFRLMTRWLIRATYGDIPQPRQRAVVDKNRRIGVGFFGFHGWLALSGIKYSECWKDEYVQTALRHFRKTVDVEAVKYSDELGIPHPVKTTTVAPTGTVAILPGVSSGLQPIFAPWFKRRVRYADTDVPLQELKKQGYPNYPDKDALNTEIVEFWCEDPLVSIVRGRGLDAEALVEGQDQIEFTDYLEVQALVQDIYANNAISFTINIPEAKMPNEPEMVTALGKILYRLKGTTVFPDKSRENAPFERLTKEQFEGYAGPKEFSNVEDPCKGGCPVDGSSAFM